MSIVAAACMRIGVKEAIVCPLLSNLELNFDNIRPLKKLGCTHGGAKELKPVRVTKAKDVVVHY